MITGGYLSKLVFLASAVEGGGVKTPDDMTRIRGVLIAETDRLVQLARDLNVIDEFTPFHLDATGRKVAQSFSETGSCEVPFRLLLSAYVRNKIPGWAFRIPAGRKETCAVLTLDEKKCFQAAGLLRNMPDDPIVQWWQDLASFIRSISQERNTETGTCGEQLSLRYERNRTGMEPKWIAFETSFAGYDILSVNSSTDTTPRPIEVKSSSQSMEKATFFFSDNEWSAAQRQLDRYHIHLWSRASGFQLADISARLLAPHIPNNRKNGVWKSVEIPFSAFSSYFIANPF